MIDVVTEITIMAPITKVFEYAANPDNAPSWYINIKSVDWKTTKPARIGSKVAFVAQFLNRKLSYIYEFIELIPGSKLVMRTSEGPFPMETTYAWRPIDDNSTQMTLRNRGMPKGFSKLFAPFMKMRIRRANKKDLEKLKYILENS